MKYSYHQPVRTNPLHRIGRYTAAVSVLVLLAGICMTALNPGHAQAAITTLGTNTAVSPNGTRVSSQSVNAPSGLVSGSVMLAQVLFDPNTTNTTTITAPTGWTLAGVDVRNGNWHQDIYWKVAGASEPTAYTWSVSRTSYMAIGVAAYSGVDTTSPIDDIGSQYSTSNSTTQTAPAVTASANGDLMVGLWGYRATLTASGYSTGLTQQWATYTSNAGIAAASKPLSNAGSSGTISSSTATATTYIAHSVALLPAQRPAGISYVGSNTPATCTGCTSLAASAPTGWAGGDFFITSVFWTGNTTLTAPDASWIQIGSTLIDGTYQRADFYHIAADTDPASYTWQFSAASQAIIGTADFGGVDTAAPIDDTQTAIDASSVTTHTAPSVTSTHSNDTYVGIWSYEANDIASTTLLTATLNLAWNTSNGSSIGSASAYEPLGNAGATGTRYTTSTNNGRTRSTIALMRSLALKPYTPLPKLVAPVSGTTGTPLTIAFQLKNYELVAGTEQYKIELCANSTCTSILQTFDQSLSQTGWSGQDAGGGTAYVGGTSYATSTLATYTTQTPLSPGTQYWWRGYSSDPALGYWSVPSNIATFTTSYTPAAPTLLSPSAGTNGVPQQPQFKLATTDADADNVQYKVQLCADIACTSVLYTADQTISQTGWSGQDGDNFTTYGTAPSVLADSTPAYFNLTALTLAPQTTYYWRAYAIDPYGSNLWSPASSIQAFSTNRVEVKILSGKLWGSTIL